MKSKRLLLLCVAFAVVTVTGCGVTMYTRATAVPELEMQPESIFVVTSTRNLDKYMYGAGRSAAKRMVRELRARGVTAWSYDETSLDLARKSLEDSLKVCTPEAVLFMVEKGGLVGKSWGSTSIKEFEIESRLFAFGSEEVVWQARTTGKVDGSPSHHDTHIKIAEQILAKLAANGVVPPAPPPKSD